jgi:aminopeptidase
MFYEEKLARLICEYSLDIKENQIVEIRGEVCAEPLIKALYKKILQMGAYPIVKMSFTEQLSYFYKYANENQLKMIPESMMVGAKTHHALIHIDSESNTKQLSVVDKQKVALNRNATKILKDIMFEREAKGDFKWTIAPYPTSSMAQDAEMDIESYSQFVFDACKLNEDDPVAAWNNVKDYQEGIVKRLTGTKIVRIVGDKTDLTLNVEGRKWINCCGKHNMPDGEVFTSPVENSATGTMFFDMPTSFLGVEVQGVLLKFENGKVIDAKAEKNEDFLIKMLETDEGAKFVGEIAFGLNENIKFPSKNILFDEKIGETMHLAVGSSYPEAGGKNKSGLHWDLIKSMKNGEVFCDGKLIYKNGRFIDG